MPIKYGIIILIIIGLITTMLVVNGCSDSRKKNKSNKMDKDTTKIIIGNKEYVINNSQKEQNDKSNKPEKPQSFGYKCSWLAIKSLDTQKIVRDINLYNIQDANWSNGLGAAYDMKGQVFITPHLGEWSLIIGLSLPDSGDSEHEDGITPLLIKLSKEFGEVQYFGTHRVVEYNAWAKAVNGKIVRAYAYIGERGETVWNIGVKTKEEVRLGLNFFDEKSSEAKNDSYWERNDLRYPDEEDVLNLSKGWSIDTSFENNSYPVENGFIGTIKKK